MCNQSSVFSPKEKNTTAAFRSAKEETKEQIFKAGCSRHGMAAGRVLYNIGLWIRETGQALDRAGCRLQGNNVFKEPCMSSETLITGFFSFCLSSSAVILFLFSSSLRSQSLNCALKILCLHCRLETLFGSLLLNENQLCLFCGCSNKA